MYGAPDRAAADLPDEDRRGEMNSAVGTDKGAPTPRDGAEAAGADPVAQNVAALLALFPAAGADGAVDFDVLRQLLGEAVEDGDERYGLCWPGKRRARALALTRSTATLRPKRDDSVDWDTTRNLMIEGDNLEVLKLLRKSFSGQVHLITIDPPYNTGSDFIYPDDYGDGIGAYLRLTGQVAADGTRLTSNPQSSGRYHTAWLNMMYPRLLAARDLLRDDGLLVCHIDEHELAHLIDLLGEVFGEENEAGILVWDKRNPKGDARGLAYQHETVVLWARDFEAFSARNGLTRPKRNAVAMLAKAAELVARHGPGHLRDAERDYAAWLRKQPVSGGEAAYNRLDANGDVYRPVSMAWPNKKPAPDAYFLPLRHPVTGQDCPVPERGWRNPPETMRALLEAGQILFGPDHTTQPQRKYLLKNNLSENLPSILAHGGSDDALLARLGIPFDNPKPVAVAREMIRCAAGPDATVLDFFAGSGTTGHAVMAENAADGGCRRFILIQLPEPLAPGNREQRAGARFCATIGKPPNLAELTKERLRRAAGAVRDAHPEASGDFGFRTYALATSNLRAWDPGDDLAADLLRAAAAVAPDRSEDDLLTELLLDRGIDPATPTLTERIAGLPVHAIGGGVLLACLAPVSAAAAIPLADGIADWIERLTPADRASVVFLDEGFEDDVAKANVAARLAQRLGPRLLAVRSL